MVDLLTPDSVNKLSLVQIRLSNPRQNECPDHWHWREGILRSTKNLIQWLSNMHGSLEFNSKVDILSQERPNKKQVNRTGFREWNMKFSGTEGQRMRTLSSSIQHLIQRLKSQRDCCWSLINEPDVQEEYSEYKFIPASRRQKAAQWSPECFRRGKQMKGRSGTTLYHFHLITYGCDQNTQRGSYTHVLERLSIKVNRWLTNKTSCK